MTCIRWVFVQQSKKFQTDVLAKNKTLLIVGGIRQNVRETERTHTHTHTHTHTCTEFSYMATYQPKHCNAALLAKRHSAVWHGEKVGRLALTQQTDTQQNGIFLSFAF